MRTPMLAAAVMMSSWVCQKHDLMGGWAAPGTSYHEFVGGWPAPPMACHDFVGGRLDPPMPCDEMVPPPRERNAGSPSQHNRLIYIYQDVTFPSNGCSIAMH